MEPQSEPEITSAPRSSRAVLRWIAGVVLALGGTGVLWAVVLHRWRTREEEVRRQEVAAERVSSGLSELNRQAEEFVWTGCEPDGLRERWAKVEARIAAGEFELVPHALADIELEIARGQRLVGEFEPAARRSGDVVRARLEAGGAGERRPLPARLLLKFSGAEQAVARARTEWARALLAAGDLAGALREAGTASAEWAALEAEQPFDLLFLPGVVPAQEARVVLGRACLAAGRATEAAEIALAALPEDDGFLQFGGLEAHTLDLEIARSRGDIAAAVGRCRQTLARVAKTLAPGDVRAVRLTHELALTLAAGDESGWDEALTLLEKTLAARRAAACAGCAGLADHFAEVGRLLAKMGDGAGAGRMLESARDVNARLFGESDPRAIAAGEELARLVVKDKPLDREAASLARAVASSAGGDDTDARVVELNELARALKAAGKVRESEPYYTAALEMQQRLVAVAGGGDDAGVATLMNNVGLVKTDLGERAEGRRWLEESLAMRRRLFLDHHADVVESLINLASWHHDDSDFARTFELESEAVAIMRRLTPGDDMLLAIAIDNLGSTVCDLGRLDDSIALHREALAMERRLVKGDDATVAQTLCELGVTLYLTDRNEEAIAFIAESLHMRRRLYAEGHPRIVDTLVHLGHAQADADEAIPAAESFREVLTTCARAPQDHTRSLVQALKGLARACAASASYAADESTLTTAARGILAERNLPSELRERCRAVMAEYYRGWQAQAPDAATAARAREWAAPR